MQIGQLQQRAWRGAPSQPAANSRGALVIRAFTQQTMDSRAAQHAVPNMQQPYKDLGPYMLWDKALKVRAVWDSRAHNQAELNSVVSVLEEHALDTITVDHTHGSRGQELTTLTLVCKADDGDQVAAALLQLTPTTHITATACEQCYLPQHTVTVHTDYGPVDLHLSLAGSRVCKSTPNWQHCEQAAAGQDGVDATAVAAAAIQQLQAGLADGSIDLGTQYLY